jgi:hypothetical protein
MEQFKRYFDNIKAEDELKDKTKQFLKKALAEQPAERLQIKKINRRSLIMNKIIKIASCAAVVVLLCMIGFTYYNTPVNYVSLDINPSVEIGINGLDKVVSAEAHNEDGEKLLEGKNIIGLSVKDAINYLVQDAIDLDYVKDDGSTVIAVTAESGDGKKALDLQDKSSNGVNLAMSAKETIAAVYSDCSDLSLRNEAKDLGVSPGKYKLIKMLQTLDPTVTVEAYKDLKVHDIISKAAELLAKDDASDSSDEELNKIFIKIKSVNEEMNKNKEKAKEKKQDKEEKDNKDNDNKDEDSQDADNKDIDKQKDENNGNINNNSDNGNKNQDKEKENNGNGQDNASGKGQKDEVKDADKNNDIEDIEDKDIEDIENEDNDKQDKSDVKGSAQKDDNDKENVNDKDNGKADSAQSGNINKEQNLGTDSRNTDTDITSQGKGSEQKQDKK